jgi:hypothetical protein
MALGNSPQQFSNRPEPRPLGLMLKGMKPEKYRDNHKSNDDGDTENRHRRVASSCALKC